MPVEQHEGGGTTITGSAIGGFRAIVLLSSIRLYLATGMKPTRGVGVARMAELSGQYTGRTYPRSRKGLEAAVADLELLKAGKSLDALGETEAVNRLVGGVAADLSP
jgi:hypothetical protein